MTDGGRCVSEQHSWHDFCGLDCYDTKECVIALPVPMKKNDDSRT